MQLTKLVQQMYGYCGPDTESQFWADVPALPAERLAEIVRAVDAGERYGIIAAYLRHACREQAMALKALFSAEEIAEMLRR